MAQGRLVVKILICAALAMAAVLAFFWNSQRTLPAPLKAIGFEPAPAYQLESAFERFRYAEGSLERVDMTAISAALRAAPLADEPFTFAALEAQELGDTDRARELISAAIRRDPRALEARALRLDLLARAGDTGAVVREIEILMRLASAGRRELLQALTYYASLPETRVQALEAISENRNREAVLTELARNGASASMLLNAISVFGWDTIESDPELATRLAMPLIETEDYAGAFRLWSAFQSDAGTSGDLVRDPSFLGIVPAPFGWETRGSDRGYARTGKEGLIGQFYGRADTLLARQLQLWEPGSYEIAVTGDFSDEGIVLEFDCVSGDYSETFDLHTFSASRTIFEVPSKGCNAQWLSLAGRASDPPTVSDFAIRRLTVERVGP